MWFGIGKMCLEKKYDQYINVPNNYYLIQMLFQYPTYW